MDFTDTGKRTNMSEYLVSPVNASWCGFGGPPDGDADVDIVALARIQGSVWESPRLVISATFFN